MSFSVSDGVSMASTTVQVSVLGGAGDGPQRDPAASLSLEVREKSSTVIKRSHLAYTVSENRCILGRETSQRIGRRLWVLCVTFRGTARW